MNSFLMFASIGSDLAETARATGEKFGVQTPLFVAQVISFLIVAALLYQFAYKPILQVLEERREKIAEGLANAEQIKQELANALARTQELLTQANAQGNKLIEEARVSAAKVLEQETQKAIVTANEIITRARQANDAELARMKSELRKEVGRLVVATSAKVTGDILTTEQQGRLAEQTAKELAAN
jgi:F-type H+-transporting ATPase subunit b